MAFDHRRTVTFRLAHAAHACRVRAGRRLTRIGLHSGQESLLKALAEEDGCSMGDLAAALGVQPPTVTKMIGRLAAQGHVERRTAKADSRQALVFLTARGRDAIAGVDRIWKRTEKDALSGIDDKDRKKLRKLLRQIERNLGARHGRDDDDPAGDDEDGPGATSHLDGASRLL